MQWQKSTKIKLEWTLLLLLLHILLLLGRVAVKAQRPVVIKLSRGRSVGLCVGRSVGASVCRVHCGKTADQIRMPFGVIRRTGSGMRQVVGFGIGPREGVLLGANLGRAIVANGDLLSRRRGPLPKLLWADLLLLLLLFYWCTTLYIVYVTSCVFRNGHGDMIYFRWDRRRLAEWCPRAPTRKHLAPMLWPTAWTFSPSLRTWPCLMIIALQHCHVCRD